jgi:4-amino-4-deoxy-L-arabinose transferase-like glycosyltransferase
MANHDQDSPQTGSELDPEPTSSQSPTEAQVDSEPGTTESTTEATAVDPKPDANIKETKSLPASEEEEPLLPRGNRPRWVRGGKVALLGAVVTIALMASPLLSRLVVPLATLSVALCVCGLLDVIGSFDDAHDKPIKSIDFNRLTPTLAIFGALVLGTISLLNVAVAGHLPAVVLAALVPAAFIGCLVAGYHALAILGPMKLDEDGQPRSIWQRHGFWVIATSFLLYLPTAGSHSLSDPWETHYGEVAREILARKDWISTWWAQDGWFWSKPVLDFWIQSLAMVWFGVDFEPGQMLAHPGLMGTPHPEWAVRMPVILIATTGVYLLYKGVSKAFGRRVALFGALILLTVPQWSFITRQTMTDMPFVGCLTAAMGLILWGMNTPQNEQVKLYEISFHERLRIRLSLFHLVVGGLLLVGLPQAFYLLSRNVSMVPLGFHSDVFTSGSAGNCGLPGNQACATHFPVVRWLQPALQGGLWILCLGLFLFINWGERRTQRLLYQGAFLFASLSTLAKGPAGLVFPIACILGFLLISGRLKELTRLELLSGTLMVLAIAMPWYVAMYGRHGPPFVDRLIFHDMWKRALSHVHDTNQGDDVSFRFYIWQLGYALFPWTGLIATGMLWWARQVPASEARQKEGSIFLVLWFAITFGLFTYMQTKFHHYIFPAVPPMAMLGGVVLNELLGKNSADSPDKTPILSLKKLSWLLYAVLLAIVGTQALFPGSVWGTTAINGEQSTPAYLSAVVLIGMSAVLGVVAWLKQSAYFGASSTVVTDGNNSEKQIYGLLLSSTLFAGAALVAVVGRDLSSQPKTSVEGQARLLHLFTYNYQRPWPDSLQFSGMLAAITLVAIVAMVMMMIPKVRKFGVISMVVVALVSTSWEMNVYFVKTSPHWGQRETIAAYYQLRANENEPIIAYQMNWKGENFYTGNKLPAFVSSGIPFKNYVQSLKRKGTRTMFFATEHTRLAGLRGELGNPTHFKVITDKRLNNKFTLVRVQF